jgi:uncharacterized protein (TIGR03067 family)
VDVPEIVDGFVRLGLRQISLHARMTIMAEDAKDDLDNLQGTWVLVAGERDGKKFTEEEVKKTKLFIKGDTFRIPESSVATSEDGTIKIDPSEKSKEMNATTGSGPDMGKTWQGIYELAADTYKVCFAPPGKDRPTEFSSKAGSGHLLQVWRRERE